MRIKSFLRNSLFTVFLISNFGCVQTKTLTSEQYNALQRKATQAVTQREAALKNKNMKDYVKAQQDYIKALQQLRGSEKAQ